MKQYKDLLEKMKKVYPYDDKKTEINYFENMGMCPKLELRTKDEDTGVMVVLSERIEK